MPYDPSGKSTNFLAFNILILDEYILIKYANITC